MKPSAELSKAFEALIERIEDKNLTLQEISINTGIDENILSIFLDRSNNVVSDLSKLFSFMHVSIKFRVNQMQNFVVTTQGNQYYIKRHIEPKCSLRYNPVTGKYHSFHFKAKKNPLNNTISKQLLSNELADELELYLKKNSKY